LPLRWQVIAGKQADAPAMHELLARVRGLSWVGQAPVVLDRSMGTSSEIRKLLRTKLRFVTALKVTEFGSYTDAIPHQALQELEPSPKPPTDGQQDPCVQEAARRVAAAGMQQVCPSMYVLELGVVQRDAPVAVPSAQSDDLLGQAMRLTRQLEQMVQQGAADSEASAERRLGASRHAAKWYRQLRRLEPSIQQELIDGKAAALSISKLTKLAKLADAEQQRGEYERLLVEAKAVRASPASSSVDAEEDDEPQGVALTVRAVLSFNPERVVEQRRKAQQQLIEVQSYVKELNRKLAQPRCRRTPRHIEKELERMLSRKSLLDVFELEVSESSRRKGAKRYVAHAELDVQRWQRRRRYDGFSMIVGHPELPHSAAELCRLYRAKDQVEADFRIIKSLVKLRPIRHHTTSKVRAHVTLCMLSLLLERALSIRLGTKPSAAMALETLGYCCLNRYVSKGQPSSYVVTHPNQEQRALLKALKLEHIVDDDALAERIVPR
jgi:hypothetical protein